MTVVNNLSSCGSGSTINQNMTRVAMENTKRCIDQVKEDYV